MEKPLACWQCGASIAELPVPLARLAECSACHVDLHVCRMCEFYDTGVAGACREPVAERVQDKQRANFCGYFRPAARHAAASADAAAQTEAQAKLAALFGLAGSASAPERSARDAARTELDELFDLDDGDE